MSGPPTTHEGTGPVLAGGHDEAEAHHEHPGDAQYIKIALILAVITGVEVFLSYWHAVKDLLAPLLIVLSIVKFAIVVAFFMHLRFDSRLFRRLFIAGIGLALFCFTIVLTTFHVWTR